MKKFAPIFVSLLAACGLEPAADPIADAVEDVEPGEAASAPRITTRSESLTGIDCGTVIAKTDGEYLLNTISQLEAIDRSACNYFVGNVRVAFTVPLVPTAQKYLFQPRSVREVTGRIVQAGKTGPTTQLVNFVGLDKAGTIEGYIGQACPYPALRQATSVKLDKPSVTGCPFAALVEAEEIHISGLAQITGFNALTRVGQLFISGGAVAVTGFKSLVNGGEINLSAVDSLTANKWTGSFPLLATAAGLSMSRINLQTFTLPKLQSVSGDVQISECIGTLWPLKPLKQIGGDMIVQERTPYIDGEHIGPANLTEVGGNLTIKMSGTSVSGYPKLQKVGGTLSVSCPGHLSQVRAFPELTTTGGLSILVDSTSIRGFSKLQKINGSLRIVTYESATAPMFDAFPVLEEITGSVDLTQTGEVRTNFPLLRTVGGDFRYAYDVISGSATGFCGYPSLVSVGGDLTSLRCTTGFSGLLTVGGTLSILDAQGFLYYYLKGYRKVYSVGGDLVLDKDFETVGPDGTQRLLDQLTTFGGTVILK